MDGEMHEMGPTELAEERLRLEREALALERERLAAARAHAAAEAKLAKARHPALVIASVALLALLCFAGGLLSGMAIMAIRQEGQREERLARALAPASGAGTATNGAETAAEGGGVTTGQHVNVRAMVFQ